MRCASMSVVLTFAFYKSLPADAVVISNQFQIYGWKPTGPSENAVFVYQLKDQLRLNNKET